jgi:hypothetical protein
MCFSNDGKYLAYRSGFQVNIMSTETLEISKTIQPKFNPVIISFSPCGRFMALGSHPQDPQNPNKLAIYEIESEECMITVSAC